MIQRYLVFPKLTIIEHLVGDSEPCSPGHEFSAIVAEVHPSVTGFSIGDHVVVNPLWRCDGCHMCANGRPNLCLNQKYHGYNLDGGLSESLVIDAARCYRVPESVGLDIAALVEPLSVAWHAVQSSGLQKAKSVMVIGTGPVGIATILCLQALGVDNIMVVGRSPVRNEFVKSLGIKNVYLSSDEGLLRTSKSLFDGYVFAVITKHSLIYPLVLAHTLSSMPLPHSPL